MVPLKPEVARPLGSKLKTSMDEYGESISEGQEGEFSEAVEQQLRELGYLD